MLDDIDVVDTHFHLIDYENNPYPWLAPDAKRPNLFGGRDGRLAHTFVEVDYWKGAEGVPIKKGVHLQANWDPEDPIGETIWLHERIAQNNGWPNAVVGYANLAQPDVEEILAAHASYPHVRGVRHIGNWSDDPAYQFTDRGDYMVADDWRRGYALLEKYGFSFDMQIYHTQMDDALDLARTFPDTLINLNHAGMPIFRGDDDIAAWLVSMKKFAQAPNVNVKISGLGLGDPDWTLDSMRPILRGSIEAFGTDRVVFGSNFPVDGLFHDFPTTWQAFDDLTADFSKDERKAMFQTNAERIYRI